MSITHIKALKPQQETLEDNKVWQEACSIAEHIYSKLGDMPESEKWVTTRKLQSTANDLMFYVSQAVGGTRTVASEYDWNSARKDLNSLKTMYRFAGRQKFIELEPEMMVRFNKLQKLIDAEIEADYDQAEAAKAQDLEFWQGKYKLWKATNL